MLGLILLLAGCEGVPDTYNDAAQEVKYRQQLAESLAPNVKQLKLDPFSERLKQGYIELSDVKWQDEEKESSKVYAQKALDLMQGVPVMPAEFDGGLLTPVQMTQKQENIFLKTKLKTGLRKSFPSGAAYAQLMYDCWVIESEIYGSTKDSQDCEKGYYQAKKDIVEFSANPQAKMMYKEGMIKPARDAANKMGEAPSIRSINDIRRPVKSNPNQQPIFTSATFSKTSPENKNVPTSTTRIVSPNTAPIDPLSFPPQVSENRNMVHPSGTMKKKLTTLDFPYGQEGMYAFTKEGMPAPYIIDFGYDRIKLSDATKKTLDKIIEDIKRYHPDRLLITGHSDKSGRGGYNLDLSEERVWSLIGYMRLRGMPLMLFDDLRAYGENLSRQPTKDGIKSKQNRYGKLQFLKLKEGITPR